MVLIATVRDGIRIGFAEMRLKRGKRSMLERSMVSTLLSFKSKVYGCLDRRERRRGEVKQLE